MKALLAGVTTIVAVLPTATEAVTVAPVEAVPPLIVTEHQSRKFMTVSVAVVPPASAAPPELLLDPLELPLDPPLEPPLDPLLDPLLPVASAEASDFSAVGDELLLHARAAAAANAAMPVIPSRFVRMMNPSVETAMDAYAREADLRGRHPCLRSDPDVRVAYR